MESVREVMKHKDSHKISSKWVECKLATAKGDTPKKEYVYKSSTEKVIRRDSEEVVKPTKSDELIIDWLENHDSLQQDSLTKPRFVPLPEPLPKTERIIVSKELADYQITDDEKLSQSLFCFSSLPPDNISFGAPFFAPSQPFFVPAA